MIVYTVSSGGEEEQFFATKKDAIAEARSYSAYTDESGYKFPASVRMLDIGKINRSRAAAMLNHAGYAERNVLLGEAINGKWIPATNPAANPHT